MGLALGALVAFSVLLWGCSRSAAEEMDLWGTSWAVVTVGDVAVPPGEITLTFPSTAGLDQTATIRTGCRTIVLAVAWDYSHDGMSFEAPPLLASACATDSAARDQALAKAIEGTTDWSIDGIEGITLHGSADIRLHRLGVPALAPS
jgi:hypothetical protein